MSTSFKRTIENFVCENCGARVEGTGYTNHCPVCLWSKHVDINPGDRVETCRGMMRPVDISIEGQKTYILHKCVECGFEKRNKTQEGDNIETILETMQKKASSI